MGGDIFLGCPVLFFFLLDSLCDRETAVRSATVKLLWGMRQFAPSGRRVVVSGISADSDTWKSM